MSSITVNGTPRVQAPRGASWFARAAEAVKSLASAMAASLRTPAHADRTAHEARELRSLARRLAAHDPALAADLQAAADRHEGGGLR